MKEYTLQKINTIYKSGASQKEVKSSGRLAAGTGSTRTAPGCSLRKGELQESTHCSASSSKYSKSSAVGSTSSFQCSVPGQADPGLSENNPRVVKGCRNDVLNMQVCVGRRRGHASKEKDNRVKENG